MVTKEENSRQNWEEILTNSDLFPVFQPIVSCETQSIYGYEILGRYSHQGGEDSSLGPFFLTSLEAKKHISTRNRYLKLKKDIDRIIREKALKIFAERVDDNTKLFINITPHLMLEYINSMNIELPFTIRKAREFGIRPERIVIEITEERIDSSIPDHIGPLLNIYRDEGYQIAVDDVGSESSNLDRIGLFHPEIIKVDLQMLRRSVFSRNFKEILVNLSKLGESLGSSLLFEGIETEDELFNSIQFGARYLQGYYFAKPQKQFQESNSFQQTLKTALGKFHNKRLQEIQNQVEWEKKMSHRLDQFSFDFKESKVLGSSLELEMYNLREIPCEVFRVYLTDLQGYQVSPNYQFLENGGFEIDIKPIGNNWSWRSYFYELRFSVHREPGWTISKIYHDITENLILRTFSKMIDKKYILFVDTRLGDYRCVL